MASRRRRPFHIRRPSYDGSHARTLPTNFYRLPASADLEKPRRWETARLPDVAESKRCSLRDLATRKPLLRRLVFVLVVQMRAGERSLPW